MTGAVSPGAMPVVILISGRGSNMRVIAEQAAAGKLPISVSAVISDRADAAGLVTAASLDIPVASLSPRDFGDRAAFDFALARLIESFAPRLLVLAGFMRILGPAFTAQFSGRTLNIHPSLLPLYRGLHTHRRVLDAGDAQHGASVHFVTEELDGGPVVIQGRVPVLPGDTEATLSARVQRQEHRIFPEAVDWFAQGRLEYRDGRAWLDGAPLPTPVIREDPDST
jgi:phosphoribosylglycinamide formyltransferase-1